MKHLILLPSLWGVVGRPLQHIFRSDIAQVVVAFYTSPCSVLRVLRALRGEFSLASVLCEPQLPTHSPLKQQGTNLSLHETHLSYRKDARLRDPAPSAGRGRCTAATPPSFPDWLPQ